MSLLKRAKSSFFVFLLLCLSDMHLNQNLAAPLLHCECLPFLSFFSFFFLCAESVVSSGFLLIFFSFSATLNKIILFVDNRINKYFLYCISIGTSGVLRVRSSSFAYTHIYIHIYC